MSKLKNRKHFGTTIDNTLLESFNELSETMKDKYGMPKTKLVDEAIRLLLEKYDININE